MENTFLIDLSVKFGLDDTKLSKTADICYQLGYYEISSREFQRAATYMCTMKILDLPAEELIEEMQRKGFDGENAPTE